MIYSFRICLLVLFIFLVGPNFSNSQLFGGFGNIFGNKNNNKPKPPLIDKVHELLSNTNTHINNQLDKFGIPGFNIIPPYSTTIKPRTTNSDKGQTNGDDNNYSSVTTMKTIPPDTSSSSPSTSTPSLTPETTTTDPDLGKIYEYQNGFPVILIEKDEIRK